MRYSKEFTKVKRQAEKLIYQLALMIDDGRRKICENYGEKEIRKFSDSKSYQELTYTEQCEINKVLNKAFDIF